MSNPVVLIPARLRSSRLPNKPLAPIAGKAMIVHVVERARAANVGPVYVACAEQEILQVVKAAGGDGVLTDPELPSGTDRIYEALSQIDPKKEFDQIINLQGDLPTLVPIVIKDVLAPLEELGSDISTLVNATDDEQDAVDPNVVKAIVTMDAKRERLGRALYFTRAPAPTGEGPLFHHIGIYGFTRNALDQFARLPPSPLEKRERLEQLRALENEMTIGVCVVISVPFGVDTPADLERARAFLEAEMH
ncbi:MAG: 3-deoxy-manno-octulosonate cytidylyltransferase [Pseudomonadota bacterium]